MSDKQPWYTAGLRFECQACGGCCTGAPGYVWVTEAEIRELAEAIGYSEFEFRARFVRQVGKRMSLVELAGGDCILFDPEKRGCRVYQHRPVQCRTWPFWPTNIESPEAWENIASRCPGCNCGDVVPLEEIRRQADEMDI